MRFLLVAFFGLVFFRSTLFAQQADRLRPSELDSLIEQANYAQASAWIDRALQGAVGGVQASLLMNRMAEIEIAQGDLQRAESSLAAIDSSDPMVKAITLSNTGFLDLHKGRYDMAVEKLRDALGMFSAEGQGSSPEGIKCLTYLASVYLATGRLKQAEEHELMALQFREHVFRENSPEVASSYNNLGVICLNTDPQKALVYYEKAQTAYRSIYRGDHPKLAIAFTNLGITHTELGHYNEAVASFEKAIGIWTRLYPHGHANIALVQQNLGRAHEQLKHTSVAIDFYQKAVRQYEAYYGAKHPDLAGAFNDLGAIYLRNRQYDKALEAFQKSLLANSPETSDRQARYDAAYNPLILVYALNFKAEALEARYLRKTLRLLDLKAALTCLNLCDSIIDQVRHQRPEEADKLSLGTLSNQVYENAVRIAFTISENVFDKARYLEQAFLFSEKSKSAVLQESIADAHAKIYSGIPPGVLEEERSLKSSISSLTQQLAQSASLPRENMLRQQLYSAKLSFRDFVGKLEKAYPQYFNLRFNKIESTVVDVQNIIPDDCAVISYFVAEKARTLYTFVITRKSFQATTHSLPSDFERTLTGLRNSLVFGEPVTFNKTTNHISPLLVPHLSKNVKDVIVIPSGKLSNLPFEVLFTRLHRNYDYSSAPFLIQRYGVSYTFSANLLSKQNQEAPNANPSALLVAPVNFYQDSLQALPSTQGEVQQIATLFTPHATPVLFDNANEGFIKSQGLSQFDYIHLATHGVADELQPELSRLFLYPSADQDGKLYFGEIYNLTLHARLMVLSACQTGLGKFSKGEGVIGLSRAVLYAGSKNVVVSYWNVADQSTAMMMKDFYSFFLSDRNADFRKALRRSKMKMVSDKTYSAPYYWAPFILVGN